MMRPRTRRLLDKLFGEPEVIGDENCPVLYRWMLARIGSRDVTLPDGTKSTHSHKVMLHWFLPNSKDRDPHDHPWPFVTFILKGTYVNHELCTCSNRPFTGASPDPNCINCKGTEFLTEVMRPGTVRYRPAQHAHITQTYDDGAWTIVVTGKAARSWGFIAKGAWWPWKMYTAHYGSGMVCDDGKPLARTR